MFDPSQQPCMDVNNTVLILGQKLLPISIGLPILFSQYFSLLVQSCYVFSRPYLSNDPAFGMVVVCMSVRLSSSSITDVRLANGYVGLENFLHK